MSEAAIISIVITLVGAAITGFIGWLFRRSIGTFEAQQTDHEARIRKVEGGEQHRDHEDRLRKIESGESMQRIEDQLIEMSERLVSIETELKLKSGRTVRPRRRS